MTATQITFDEYLLANAAAISKDLSLKEVLKRLGITSNYKGYQYTLYAVDLALHDPDSLTLVTKNLYPAVAKHYHTKWHSAERSIRTVVEIAWEEHAPVLEAIAQHPLPHKPPVSQFIAILAEYISEQRQ